MKNAYYEEYWDKNPEEWTPSSGTISVDEKAIFIRYLHPGTRCLDYGCGDGIRYGKMLTEKDVQYLGFDISENAIKQAAGIGLDVKLLTLEGKTSLDESSVDVAICFEVLEHLQEPQNALAEILRCLKPGGHALISVPNAAFWTQRIEFLLTGFWCPGGSPHTARKSPWRDPHIRFYHPKLLRRFVLREGFEVAESFGESFTLGALPYVWRRPKLRAMAGFISRPIGWLGRVLPSWFGARLFIVARKPLKK